jgi:hypothetical protein
VRRQDPGPSRRERRKAEQERPKPHDCENTRRLNAAVRMLYSLSEGGQQTVMIGKVLAELDPAYAQAPPPDPRADPLFGTMPVTAPE